MATFGKCTPTGHVRLFTKTPIPANYDINLRQLVSHWADMDYWFIAMNSLLTVHVS